MRQLQANYFLHSNRFEGARQGRGICSLALPNHHTLLTTFSLSCTFSKKGTCVITTSQQIAIRKGLLEFAVLKVVGVGSIYAADILRRMQETEFATQEGTLYPLLSKLRRDGLVVYQWQESELGPPRKYYQLTDLGREQLAALDQYWKTIDQTLQQLGRRSGLVTES